MIYSEAKYVEKSILTNNRNEKIFDNIRTYTNFSTTESAKVLALTS